MRNNKISWRAHGGFQDKMESVVPPNLPSFICLLFLGLVFTGKTKLLSHIHIDHNHLKLVIIPRVMAPRCIW